MPLDPNTVLIDDLAGLHVSLVVIGGTEYLSVGIESYDDNCTWTPLLFTKEGYAKFRDAIEASVVLSTILGREESAK